MSNQVFKPDPNQDPAERMLRFFASQHLSEELRPVVERFRSNAVWLLREVPRGPERTAGMRKQRPTAGARLSATTTFRNSPCTT